MFTLNFSDQNKIIVSDAISYMGSRITDVALIYYAYSISGSATLTTIIITIRLVASFFAALSIPHIMRLAGPKIICLSIDIISACVVTSLIFVKSIETLYFVAFIHGCMTSLYLPIKMTACQKLVDKSIRTKFISNQQAVIQTLSLVSPLVAALIIKMYSINIVFLLDAVTFILAAALVSQIPEWGSKQESNDKWNKGFLYIATNKIQRRIMVFRITILSVMALYEIAYVRASISSLENVFKEYDILLSDLIGAFSIVSTLSLIAGTFMTKKYSAISSLRKTFVIGSVMIIIGCLIWAFPENTFSIYVYLFGTIPLFIGMSFLRVSLYSSGYLVTPQDMFAPVVAASDAVSRSSQAVVSVGITTAFLLINTSYIFLLFGIFTLISINNSLRISEIAQEEYSKQPSED